MSLCAVVERHEPTFPKVLEQDAMVVELRVVDDLLHPAQGVPPRVHLGGRRVEAELAEDLGCAVADEVGREAGVELHGWGECNRGRVSFSQPPLDRISPSYG